MKTLISILALFALSACGFQPVYAPNNGALATRNAITVEEIEGRSGFMLRKELQQQLASGLPGIEPGASLSIILDERLSRLAFQPDGAASRSSVLAKARYTLATDTGVMTGTVESRSDFNVPAEPFGDVTAQSYSSDRAMSVLADRIIADLRLKTVQN